MQKKERILNEQPPDYLWIRVLLGLAIGAIIGFILNPTNKWVDADMSKEITEWLALPGKVFLRLIKMMIFPLIFSSIVLGILSSGDISFLRLVGLRLLGYFVITTLLAITIGAILGYIIEPGNYFDSIEKANFAKLSSSNLVPQNAEFQNLSIPNRIAFIIPDNPFKSLIEGDTLAIVVFSILCGVAAIILKNKLLPNGAPILLVIQEVSMKIVKWALLLVPFAVAGLLAQVIASTGISALKGVGMYMFTVISGLFLMYIFYIIIILLFSRHNPFKFISAIKDVQLLAFATASSAAVMPYSIETAEQKLQIRPSIAKFVIPVGATVNMDGTALYQMVATIFLSQVFGIDIPLSTLILIAFITLGASIGTPAAPGVGIIILASILQTAGIPETGIALILGVDRILDMFRTSINVSGDLTACAVFEKFLSKKIT
jgi:Na+/H+-dicarboxylate symporter